jgi:hypothetical protein
VPGSSIPQPHCVPSYSAPQTLARLIHLQHTLRARLFRRQTYYVPDCPWHNHTVCPLNLQTDILHALLFNSTHILHSRLFSPTTYHVLCYSQNNHAACPAIDSICPAIDSITHTTCSANSHQTISSAPGHSKTKHTRCSAI